MLKYCANKLYHFIRTAFTGYSVKDLHRNTSQSGAIVFKRAPRALRSKYSDKSLDQRMSEVCYCIGASAVPL